MDPTQLRFATTHEWVALQQESDGRHIATVGISDFAMEQLTDLVHIELPSVGQQVTAGRSMGEVESVKAVSDLYSPVNGEVVEVNDQLVDQLETLSDDPYGTSWMVKIRLTNDDGMDELLDHAAYQSQCASEG